MFSIWQPYFALHWFISTWKLSVLELRRIIFLIFAYDILSHCPSAAPDPPMHWVKRGNKGVHLHLQSANLVKPGDSKSGFLECGSMEMEAERPLGICVTLLAVRCPIEMMQERSSFRAPEGLPMAPSEPLDLGLAARESWVQHCTDMPHRYQVAQATQLKPVRRHGKEAWRLHYDGLQMVYLASFKWWPLGWNKWILVLSW